MHLSIHIPETWNSLTGCHWHKAIVMYQVLKQSKALQYPLLNTSRFHDIVRLSSVYINTNGE